MQRNISGYGFIDQYNSSEFYIFNMAVLSKQPQPESGFAGCLVPFGMVIEVLVAFSEATSVTLAAATYVTRTVMVVVIVSCILACTTPVRAFYIAGFH